MNINLKALITSLTGFKEDTELEKSLTDPNLPLEEYLKKPDAVQCFQDMKSNAQKYFDRNKIIQLIKYITQEPKEDEYNKGYKFPYVASDMLRQAPKRIRDMLILPEDEFNKLYNIPNNDDKIKENSIKENPEDKNDIKENEEKKNVGEIKDDKEVKEDKDNNKKNQNLIIETQDISNINATKNKKETRKYNITKRNDILDLLLDFVTNKNTPILNDVLCGYFYRTILSLLDEYSIDIFLYLFFLRQDALEQIVMHSYQKSLSFIAINVLKIEELFSKIVKNVIENRELIDINLLNRKKESFIILRTKLIEKLITSIDLNGLKNQKGEYMKDDIDVESVFTLLEELSKIDNNLFTNNKIITNHIFNVLEQNIYSNDIDIDINPNINQEKQKYIYNQFIILLTNILKNSEIDEIKKDNFYPEFNYVTLFDNIKKNQNLNFEDKLMIYIPKILSLNYQEIICSNEKNKLGLHNIYIMDLIIEYFIYTKNTPILFDFIILQSGFMDRSINYFFTYQLNNIYHNKFLKLFTLYLQEAESHPLLTDYFFIRKDFHKILVSFISKKVYENNNGVKYINKYEYKSGKTILSCMHIYVIDLIYKIQAACGLKLFDENDQKNLNIINLGHFEFIKDETSPKEIKPFKMPIYVKEILNSFFEWDETVKMDILPKIKIFEGKLIFSKEEMKPKLTQSSNTVVLTNLLNSLVSNLNLLSNKNKLMKKDDSMTNNYTDVNFWKVNNTISDETKNKINSKIDNNSNELDDEDELLNIAMNLEKKEKEKNNIKIKPQPKINFAVKNEINTSSSNLKTNNDNNNDEIKNEIPIKKDDEVNKNDIKKE